MRGIREAAEPVADALAFVGFSGDVSGADAAEGFGRSVAAAAAPAMNSRLFISSPLDIEDSDAPERRRVADIPRIEGSGFH